MTGYLVRRVAWMVPTFLGITLLTFLAVHAAPGDPVGAMLGADRDGVAVGGPELAARRAALERRYGFDRPLAVQYLNYLGPFNLLDDGHPWFGGDGRRSLGGLLALDLGREVQRPGVAVGAEVRRRLGVTVPLALSAFLLTALAGTGLGVWSALRAGRVTDRVLTVLSFALFSTPAFLGAVLLVLAFGETGLGWLPALGIESGDAAELTATERTLDRLRHAVLPVVALSYAHAAYLARHVREALVEALRSDAVRTARALGLPERTVVGRRALRHALLPAITLLGGMLPLLIGGSFVIETVFDLPGVGRYSFEGFLRRDVNVILASTTLGATAALVGMLFADVLYVVADPRVDPRESWGGRRA